MYSDFTENTCLGQPTRTRGKIQIFYNAISAVDGRERFQYVCWCVCTSHSEGRTKERKVSLNCRFYLVLTINGNKCL